MRPDLSVSGRSSFPDVILLGYLGPIYEEACMAKAEKATAVADIAEQFKDSTATLVTEYRGLTVANLKDLRRSLGDTATYTVAKNTLVKRAAAEAGIEGLDELFVGPTAIAFVKGESASATKPAPTHPGRPAPERRRRARQPWPPPTSRSSTSA